MKCLQETAVATMDPIPKSDYTYVGNTSMVSGIPVSPHRFARHHPGCIRKWMSTISGYCENAGF